MGYFSATKKKKKKKERKRKIEIWVAGIPESIAFHQLGGYAALHPWVDVSIALQ